MKSNLFRLRTLVLSVFIALSCACTPLSEDGLQQDSSKTTFKFSSDIRLNDDEQKADLKMETMRKQLTVRYRDNWSFYTSFVSWKSRIRQEDLYKTIARMPKGGMLHLHTTATGDASWVITRALSMPESYIFWGKDSANAVHGQLAVFPGQSVPAGWCRLSELKHTHPDLQNELYALYTFGPEDASCTDIWAEFESALQRIDGFISYRPVFLDFYRNALETIAADGIQFVELRTSLDPVLNEDGSYTADEGVMDLYQDILTQVNNTFPGFGLKLIICDWRGNSIENVRLKIEKTRVLHSKYPGMIVGFDLVGEEDSGNSNGYYGSALSTSPVPLFLHAGETRSPANHNIQEAIDLHAPRISHGINLHYFPELEQTIIQQGTLLEVCPISNLELRYIDDFREHPAIDYLENGVQCTLGSDDPLIFQTRGLTDDFFVAYVCWGLDLKSLKKLALNSITYSGQTEEEKHTRQILFNAKWDEFIRFIVYSTR